MKKTLLILSLYTFFYFNGKAQTPQPIFQSGFETGVSLVDEEANFPNNRRDDIIGAEFGVIYPYSHWVTTLEDNPNFGDFNIFFIQYIDGIATQRKATIQDDPEIIPPANNKVLKFQINEPSNAHNGRIQAVYNSAPGELIGTGYEIFHYSVKLYLPDYFDNYLNDTFERDWFTLAEFFNDIGNNAVYPEDFPFRMTMHLRKKEISGVDGFVLSVEAQKQVLDNTTNEWIQNWEEVLPVWTKDTNEHIPAGEWITLKIYIKEGDFNNGEFNLEVIDDSDSIITSFKVDNYTHHPDNPEPDGITHIQPMKLYTSDEMINQFNCGEEDCSTNPTGIGFNPDIGEGIEVYWDDFTIYDDSKLKPRLIKLIENDCGTTLEADDMTLSTVDFPNVGNGNDWKYKFRFENIADSLNVIVIESNQNTIDLSDYPNQSFIGNGTYKVHVKIESHPYYRYYGLNADNDCLVTLPHLTELKSEYHGVTVTSGNGVIECYEIYGATTYKFRIVETTSGVTRYYNSSTNSIDITQTSWYDVNTRYTITVRALGPALNNGNGFGYGNANDINLNGNRSTIIQEDNIRALPNPVKGELMIVEGVDRIFNTAIIFDMYGKQILSKMGIKANKIDVSSLSPGIYILRVIGKSGKPEFLRFVKAK